MSLFSWMVTNQASAYVSLWLGNHQFGDFSVSLRIAHNLAHLFIMGQEATLLMYLSKYQHEPQKQTGLIQWVIQSTLIKTFAVLSFIALALIFQSTPLDPVVWLLFRILPVATLYRISFSSHTTLNRNIPLLTLFSGFVFLMYYVPISSLIAQLYAAVSFFTGIHLVINHYSVLPTDTHEQPTHSQKIIDNICYILFTLTAYSLPFISLFSLMYKGIAISNAPLFAALCNLIFGYHLLSHFSNFHLATYLSRLYISSSLFFILLLFDRTMWVGFAAIPFIVICGIYERFFLFLRHFFVSFIPRGLFHPVLLIGFIYLVYSTTPSSEVALWLYTFAFLIAGITSAIFGYHSGFQLTEKGDKSDIQKWKTSGRYYTLSTLIIKSTPSMALLLLKKLGPDIASVAHFAAICNLIYGFHLLTKPFDSYLKPYVARLYADNEIDTLQKTINFINMIRWITIIILFLGLTIYGEHFLSSYGEGFIDAKLPLTTLAFLSLLQYLGQPAHEILNYTGYQRELSAIMAIQLFFIISLSYLLIPSFGIWGAVIAQGIPCFLATIISSRYLYKKTKLKAYFLF